MSTNFIRSITRRANQSQNLTNKNPSCHAHERKPDTVSNYDEHIFEPIVEIISGSQDINKAVSESMAPTSVVSNYVIYPTEYVSSSKTSASESDSTSGKENEKYVFVIMNNRAPETSQEGALRILDIKSAVSGGSFPLDNVTVENVTFSADKVRSTISEVIENLPDKRNIDFNSTEIKHEYLLVLNCSIPFNINDVSANKPIGLLTTRNANKMSQSTIPLTDSKSHCEIVNHSEQSFQTSVKNNYHYETRSRLTAPKATVEKCKEGLTNYYLTVNDVKNEPETSVNSEKDILEGDDYYILVVDHDCDNTDVKSSYQSDDENARRQQKEINDCTENKEVIVPDTKVHVNVKGCKRRYFCKKCEKSFNTIKLLKKHSMRKCCRNRNKPDAKKRVLLARKMRRGRPSKNIQQSIDDNKQPLDYEGTDTDERCVACAKCKAVFKNRKILKRHILTVCNKDKTADYKRKIVCDICGKFYAKTAQFRAHMDAHENLRLFKCSECNSGFNKRWFLVRHIAQVHRKSRYMYYCSYCGLKSESKEHIEMHEQVHTLPEGAEVPRPYRCFCGKSYISKHALRCHKYTSLSHGHSRVQTRLKCPLCSKVLLTAASLNIHLGGKHDVNPTRAERAIKCDLCDKRFSWFGSYVKHKLEVHEAEVTASEAEAHFGEPASEPVRQYRPRPSEQGQPTDPLVCDVCERECKSKSALKAHKWYHHNEARKVKMESALPVSCELCHKTFVHKNSLTSHNHRCHRPREVSQLSCRICHKVFNNYGSLWSHNKYVHVKTLPYDCGVCNSKFKRKGDHTRHLKDKHGIIKPCEANETVEEEFEVDTVQDEISTDLGSFETMSYTQL